MESKNRRKKYSWFLIQIIVLVLLISGCTEPIVKEGGQEDYPMGKPSKVYHPTDEEISKLTPGAQEIAHQFAKDNYPGALGVLYDSILSAEPSNTDLLFLYIHSRLPIIFYDPPKVFELYRDCDRSNWSEDEITAADLLVGLTYQWGDYEWYYPDEQWTIKAAPIYRRIIEEQRNGKLAAIAKILYARILRSPVDEEAELPQIMLYRDQIEVEFPDSVFLTAIESSIIGMCYRTQKYDQALIEAKRVLELPDAVGDIYNTETLSAHALARKKIEDIEARR